MSVRYTRFLLAAGILLAAAAARGQSSAVFRIQFHPGEMHRVVTKEILRLHMHFPQVDAEDAKPSVRTTTYSFTETVDSVLPDGSAEMSAVLDSFRTAINFGEGPNAQHFFTFNSSDDYDISHNLHDIKVLPRAQFLGHTIRYIMSPEGTIDTFLNLEDFHRDAVGHEYPYDMVHAMLSLTDSRRMAQLLEYGMGGLAALRGPYTSPSTTTEIPVTRRVTSRTAGPGTLAVRTSYFDPPQRIEYLEGIATPMGILHYYGAGEGTATIANGYLKHSFFQDTANVRLAVDIDTVPEEITRTVTTNVFPIRVLHAARITIREIEDHKGVWKDPNADNVESDSTTRAEGTKPSGQ